MENMFLRTVLRARNFLGKSKAQEKRKTETKGLQIRLELPCKSSTWEFNLLLLLIRGLFSFTRTAHYCASDYKGPSRTGIIAGKLSVYGGCAIEIHTPLPITPWARCKSPEWFSLCTVSCPFLSRALKKQQPLHPSAFCSSQVGRGGPVVGRGTGRSPESQCDVTSSA